MPTSMTRRDFLAAAATFPLAARSALRKPGSPGMSGGDAARPALPPRVVGLKTEGGNFRFDPEGLRIEPGETLRWLNMGDFHTTTAFHPEYAGLVQGDLPLRIPEDAEPWHSGMLGLDAGTRFEHRFRTPGVHDYFCQPHYSFGMVGRVIVGEPGTGPATRPLVGLPEAARAHMPAVERIMGPEGRAFEWASRLNGVLYRILDGESAAAGAVAVRDAVAQDGALAREYGSEKAGEFAEGVAAFARDVESGVGYEELLARADAVKRVLMR